jgi:hypothetical protein
MWLLIYCVTRTWLKMLTIQLPMIDDLGKDKEKRMLVKRLMKGSCEFPCATSVDQVTSRC